MMVESSDALATVTINTGPTSLDDLVRIAHGSRIELSRDARARIEASRAIIDAAVAGPDLVYGLNTGLGHMRDERVPLEILDEYAGRDRSRSHRAAIGHAVGRPMIVRAAMAVRRCRHRPRRVGCHRRRSPESLRRDAQWRCPPDRAARSARWARRT